MLSACAPSASSVRPATAPDPVIHTRTVTLVRCPAELLLPIPPKPVPAADASLTGSASGMAWLRAVIARSGLFEDRISDAKNDCLPKEPK